MRIDHLDQRPARPAGSTSETVNPATQVLAEVAEGGTGRR